MNWFLIYWAICVVILATLMIRGIIREHDYVDVSDMMLVIIVSVFSFIVVPMLLFTEHVGNIKLWKKKGSEK